VLHVLCDVVFGPLVLLAEKFDKLLGMFSIQIMIL